MGLEKDDFGASSGGTEFFASRTGLELVVDDGQQVALSQFFPSHRADGSSSDFVVLNGAANSPSHELWEIVYTRSFRPSFTEMQEIIDSIQAPTAVPEPEPVEPARLTNVRVEGNAIHFEVVGSMGRPAKVEFSEDGLNWFELEAFTFAVAPTVVTDTFRESHRLYRVTTVE